MVSSVRQVNISENQITPPFEFENLELFSVQPHLILGNASMPRKREISAQLICKVLHLAGNVGEIIASNGDVVNKENVEIIMNTYVDVIGFQTTHPNDAARRTVSKILHP
jgi:hypothetical protein